MFRLRRASLIVTSLCILLSACSQQATKPSTEQKADTPSIESNAFRSVLDGKPRMLTINLDEQVKVAIDTQAATIYKVWQGDIDLKGAVFDSRHGPQPESLGLVYFIGDKAPASNPLFSYKGYEIDTSTGNTSILYEAVSDSGVLSISETLSFEQNETGLVLKQSFEATDAQLSGEPNMGSGIKIHAPWLNDTSTASGDATIANDNKGSAILLNGEAGSIETRYLPLAVKEEQTPDASIHPGLALIQNSDCAACHNAEVQTVGPSYTDIAKRYNDTTEARTTLANKIIKGGAGNWGQIPMTAHPDLMLDDALSMVDYIFTFKSAAEQAPVLNSLMLNQAAVDINYASDAFDKENDKPGAYVYFARLPLNQEPTLETIKATAPEMGGHAPQIHIPNADGFTPTRELFSLIIQTQLNLPEAISTKLRLVSDDGSALFLNGEQIIDNWGYHGDVAVDADIELEAGLHPIEIVYMQGLGGASLSLQWLNPKSGEFEVIPSEMLLATAANISTIELVDPTAKRVIPGDQREVAGVHPSFDLSQARPDDFEPMVGGIDFMSDGRMVVSTWDTEGSVYIVENHTDRPENIIVKRVARGLAEPLGLKVVDDDIYVLQKQELTRLVDTNGDDLIDRYELVSNSWTATANFHEFAFGLEYLDGHFYGALATAIEPGGASTNPQAPDRGKAFKINKDTGEITFIAHGLRTPNGIGKGVDGGLFIADNQGDWLPSSKIVELTEGAFYGSRSVDFEGTANLSETKPVVWLPQNEIGNSPGQPAPLNIGPYQNQMIHGEVTHGGLKRVFAERVNGRLQGAVFRFSQGFEAGINRVMWAPDGSLIVGGVGNPGNWGHSGKAWYGLQRLTYNEQSSFEMLSVSARSDGFEITFTEPVKIGQNIRPENFEIIQWQYEPTAAYGGPKLDEKALKVTAFSMSDDNTKMQFKLAGMQADRVVYFRIKHPFVSANDNELWTSEAWYTLNAIPVNKPIEINPNYSATHNQLTAQEQEQGWQLLFDGESLDGIRNYNKDTLGARWVIDDGAIHLSGKKEGEDGWQTSEGGDIVITPKPVENYELYLEWKLQAKGNSGIIYNVKERDELDYPFLSGPEMQILDNLGHADGKIVTHRAGDNYDLIESRLVTVNPPGEWNRVRLIVNNNKVEHWQNGYKVIETEMFTDEWDALIANSKFKDWPDFAKSPGGHIVLQDHGDKVWFRNIKIKELD
jgi:cytochrome c